ncbi:tumor necrosis factor receptor superfamily member 4 isoform 2-T2 [Porphyrio hochstetteri]
MYSFCTSGRESLLQTFATFRILLGHQGCIMVAEGFYSHFSTLFFLLLTVAISHCLGLKCKEHQYPFGDKCCKDCAPGERMKYRCTATADTVCVPCQDEYFSNEHNHNFCNSCTICNTRRGSVEVKKCEKTSDRICMCRPGYMPDTKYTLGSACLPCPEGSYSLGQNENCRPWTNCSILGKNILQQGTKTADAVCSNHVTQPTTSQSVTPAVNLSTTDRKNNVSTAMLSPSRPSVIPFNCPDMNNSTETKWGSLSLILICLILLMVSGMSIILLIIQAAKKDIKRRPGRKNNEGRSVRIPVQEEQIDSNSTLIKN